MARARIGVPESAKQGEVVEITALIQHPMETGYRPAPNGQIVPRDIIRRLTCSLDGEELVSIELHPAVSANPFVSFTLVAERSGTLAFAWTGDNGFAQTETATLTVA